MRSLRYLNVILTVLAVLLALQLWTAWVNVPGTTAQAQSVPGQGGGIPDAGAQRNQMIDALKKIAQQTDDLTAFLKSGGLRAKIEMPVHDSKNGG